MTGFQAQEVLAKRTGSSFTIGPINDGSLQVPNMETNMNGVQAVIHPMTLMMATLAARVSEESCCCSGVLRREATFIFLACSRSDSS